MGFFDDIVKQVGGELVTGALGGGISGGGHADVAKVVLGLLGTGGQLGGLAGLVQLFEQNGLGAIVQSWVSTGQNLPVSPSQIQSALGSDVLGQIAAQLGVPHDQAASALSQVLPHIVDQLTPGGQLPTSDSALSEAAKLFGL